MDEVKIGAGVRVVRNVIPVKPVKPSAEIVLTLSEEAAEELFRVVSISSGGDHLYSIYLAMKHATGLSHDENAAYVQYKYVLPGERRVETSDDGGKR